MKAHPDILMVTQVSLCSPGFCLSPLSSWYNVPVPPHLTLPGARGGPGSLFSLQNSSHACVEKLSEVLGVTKPGVEFPASRIGVSQAPHGLVSILLQSHSQAAGLSIKPGTVQGRTLMKL